MIAFNAFLDGPRTVDEARDVISSVTITLALLAYVGQFITRPGCCCVAQRDARRSADAFLGILGVVAGVVSVFPQLMPVPLVQSFWLVALGMMLLGIGRAELPPAWRTGKAEAWPSAKEGATRRARRRSAARDRARTGAGAGQGPAPARGTPASSSKKEGD